MNKYEETLFDRLSRTTEYRRAMVDRPPEYKGLYLSAKELPTKYVIDGDTATVQIYAYFPDSDPDGDKPIPVMNFEEEYIYSATDGWINKRTQRSVQRMEEFNKQYRCVWNKTEQAEQLLDCHDSDMSIDELLFN